MGKPITDKQCHAIKVVEKILEEKFEGSTRQEAFLWLRKHVPLAERKHSTLSYKNDDFHERSMDYLNKEDADLPLSSDSGLITQLNIDTCKRILGM